MIFCLIHFILTFLAGIIFRSASSSTLIHLRQLGLLGMLARLGEHSILQQHGRNVLLSVKSRSWFHHIRLVAPTKEAWMREG